ncbi:Bug family tripartite tricarboxylate transporter substrate binding protein [Stutzerimonas chloritidismutans]|uniref:Bug family tripartite tricarboxylate transporter substrate binding protein n=1 Tax=Stutzerimonas chloritidismutans TaxID=203192 RepID=UPI003F187302
MPNTVKTVRFLSRSLAAALLSAAASIAPTFAAEPVHIVVPYAAGGGVDIVTRMVSPKMEESLGTSIIVENRPGAATNIGSAAVATAKPDGTMLLTASNTLASNAALYSNLSFDPAKDFVTIGQIGYAPLVVVVPQDSPYQTLDELIEAGRKDPEALTYASAGNGSSGHMASELLKQDGGFEALHIPYKGGSPAITDLIGGRISFMSINPTEVVGHIKAGKLRALAVLDDKPNALLPDLPTVTSLGHPNSTAAVWWGLVGPKGIPVETIAQQNAALQAALKDDATRKRLDELGVVIASGSPEEFQQFVEAERDKWTAVIKKAGIRAD